jgi:hemoglobin/transferrin/lactoferrin receptor protein
MKASVFAGAMSLAFSVNAVEPTASPALAEEKPVTLPTVVVTATRQETPLAESPVASDVVSRQELKDRQVSTVPDALRESPGVMIQKTSTGQGSPYLRGFTGFRNLFLIDGIRLNNSVFREGPNQYWNTVDPFGLDRIELILGEGSVLYGTDAIGGTVQAVTKPVLPEGIEEGRFFADGLGLYRFGSATESHIGRLEANIGEGERWGLRLGVTVKEFGDVHAADLGTLPKTGYEEWDADAKLTIALSKDWQVTAALQHVDIDDAWRTHRTIHSRSWEGSSVGDELSHVFDQERTLGYVALEGRDLSDGIEHARITASWHRQAEDRTRTRSGNRIDFEGFEVNTFGLTADFTSPLAIGPLQWGAAFYHDDVSSYRRSGVIGKPLSKAIQGPIADDAEYSLADVYLQQKWEIAEPLDLFIGVRYSHADADAGRVEDPVTGEPTSLSDDWDTVVGSLRFLYRALPEERLHFYGGVSQGYRAPNLSDLTRFDIARSNELELPSPGLDPERFLTFELGARGRQGPLAFDASVFYTRISDMIVRQPTGQMIDGSAAVMKRNASDGYVWGFELASELQVHRNWMLIGAVAWNDGEADAYPTSANVSHTEPISRLLPLTGKLALRWTHSSGNLWAEVYGLAAAEQDRLNTSDRGDTQRIPPGGTPGYATLNLRGGWTVSDHFSVELALENLTDEDYRIHGSGQNEPGFGATLTARVMF